MKDESETCWVDEFGVTHWKTRSNGDVHTIEGHDPFNVFMSCLDHVPEIKAAALFVRDDLYTARTIAVSIFGRQWEVHVMEVYDRLLKCKDNGNKEIGKLVEKWERAEERAAERVEAAE